MGKNWETPIKNGQSHNGLAFLFRIFPKQSSWLNELCENRIFVETIAQYVNSGTHINQNLVLKIIDELFDPIKGSLADKDFKQRYIDLNGEDSWDEYKHSYHTLKRAKREIYKSTQRRENSISNPKLKGVKQ